MALPLLCCLFAVLRVSVLFVILRCSVSPKYAQEHQVAVIDCLEDLDETLKLKTLELLVTMTKSNNVQVTRAASYSTINNSMLLVYIELLLISFKLIYLFFTVCI